MKKLLFLVLSLSLVIACGSDDAPQQVTSSDYDEAVSGDLSSNHAAPTSLTFVLGQNTVAAQQSSTDTDYITFKVPTGHVLSQIVVDNYDSVDAAGFIGIVLGATFSSDASSTSASDLLGGAIYGATEIGNNILLSMGSLGGAQGFTGALLEGDYTVWLNQTGESSSVELNFIISKLN